MKVAIKRLCLALAVPLCAILLIELLPLRILFPPDPRGAAREFCAAGMFRSRDDDLRHFELKPNITVEVAGREYRHNELGLRGPPIREPKPEGTYRIAVVGDSYTYGWGVAEDETIPEQLHAKLIRDRAGGALEVINGGVPAYDTGPELGLLRDVIAPVEPDLVVLVFQTNDITTVDYFYLDDLNAFYACALPVSYSTKHALSRSRLYHLLRRGFTSFRSATGFEWFGEKEWPRTRDYLQQIVALLNRRHIPLLIANLPHFQIGSSVEFSDFGPPGFSRQSEWVNQAARELGVPCVDILPLIRARVRSAKETGDPKLLVEALYVDPVNDHHLNAQGCGLVAEALAREIERQGWLKPP
jgi:lysophospholipase L1-like esterase